MGSRSFCEQLTITDEELTKRRSFLGLTDQDHERLATIRTILEKEVEGIVEEFYDHFCQFPDLERFLAENDEQAISETAQRLVEFAADTTRVHGVIGARAQGFRSRLDQTESAVNATQVFLSEIEDLDYTEAVTRFQQAQTALQANLLSGSQLLNLSLLDFIA